MRLRFAPSPTGALHIGGARTALYNWLLARGGGGVLILRLEDTDRERSTPENVEQILDALRWLELDWDEGPYSQSERAERHRAEIARLVEEGHAYEDGGAVRLRVPDDGITTVRDAIRGEIAFDHAAIDDFVIARSDGSPLYNLAVAVDDRDMGITHVVRGEDHLSNTPRQLMVHKALGLATRRCTRTCRSSTARTARSCPSATAPRPSRSSAIAATCRRRSATTWRFWGGATTRRPPSSRPGSSWSASRSTACRGRPRSSTSRSCGG